MSDQFTVAIMGATGAVGQVMMEILAERNFPVGNLRLLASARSAGRTFTFRGEELTVQELREDSFEGIDIVLASAGGSLSKEYNPHAVAAGAVVTQDVPAFALVGGVPAKHMGWVSHAGERLSLDDTRVAVCPSEKTRYLLQDGRLIPHPEQP